VHVPICSVLITIRESFSIIAIDHYTYYIMILLQRVTRRHVIYYNIYLYKYRIRKRFIITRVLNIIPNITEVYGRYRNNRNSNKL